MQVQTYLTLKAFTIRNFSGPYHSSHFVAQDLIDQSTHGEESCLLKMKSKQRDRKKLMAFDFFHDIGDVEREVEEGV